MSLPKVIENLYKSEKDELKDSIISKVISVQDWSSEYDYPPYSIVRGGGIYTSLN